jgi:hypothetical protein
MDSVAERAPMLTALAAILTLEAAWIASIPDVAAYAPAAFIAGIAAGFLLANRYQLTRRNDGE